MISLKIIALLAIVETIYCKNILFLNGIASPSHHLWNGVLMKGLAQKGYNLTMVSVDTDINPPPNIHYIFMEATYDTIYGGNNSFDLLEMSKQSPLQAISGVYDFCDFCCEGILNSKGLDIILNYPNDFKFDAVIYDFTCGPCLLPLIHKFNYPPLISVSAFSNPPYTVHLTGGQKFPAFVPHYSLDFPQIMNFPQRIFNTLMYAIDTIGRQQTSMSKMELKVRERFNFKDFPPLHELEKKTTMMLINTDNAVDYPEPLQPNMVQVAGLQITEPKELPQKMLNFIESGKRGTVLMSLGTNIKSNMLGKETLSSIIRTFAQLPDYNFIWKFESEPHELPIELSRNVMVAKFLPQNDILAHPSVKAFVTHSGLLSTQEALWYGKPMVAIPFFCDQKRTSAKAARMGVAVSIDFRTLNDENFKEVLLKVLEDESFSNNTKKFSSLFRDKPQRALDLAIWWIEYVIRNPSAPQYDPPSLKLGWFAANSYDVFLTTCITVCALIYIVYKAIQRLTIFFKGTETKKYKRS